MVSDQGPACRRSWVSGSFARSVEQWREAPASALALARDLATADGGRLELLHGGPADLRDLPHRGRADSSSTSLKTNFRRPKNRKTVARPVPMRVLLTFVGHYAVDTQHVAGEAQAGRRYEQPDRVDQHEERQLVMHRDPLPVAEGPPTAADPGTR